jgi:hypothetical protein
MANDRFWEDNVKTFSHFNWVLPAACMSCAAERPKNSPDFYIKPLLYVWALQLI